MGAHSTPLVVRKTSNLRTEAAPLQQVHCDPTKAPRSSVVTSIIRGSSQRRRVRAENAREAALQAKKRRLAKFREQSPPVRIQFPQATQPKDVEMKDEPIATTTVILPRQLSRPAFKQVSKAKVVAIEPELAPLPLEYIQDKLAELGPDMVKVIRSVDATTTGNGLPRELAVLVNDLSSDMPSHMLAVYSRQPGGRQQNARRRVTLYPTHSIVLAANCASLPALPPSHPAAPASPTERITIPVVPLSLPDPASFPQLAAYLYTKRTDALLASLLPSPPTGDRGKDVLNKYAWDLARTNKTEGLVVHMTKARGLWLNVCALGIFDEGLWAMLDLAWEVLVNALAISSGKPLDESEPAPVRAQL